MKPLWVTVLISGLMLSSAACFMDFARTLEASQSVTIEDTSIGDVVVEERIYHQEHFPDHRYLRLYQVQTDGQSFELGRYEDEAATGMTTPPTFMADWLVVMSGAHIFFWQPKEDVRHFYPYVVEDWVEYAQERQLNGHYDYAAAAVQIDGEEWRITYRCTACLARHPAEIHFISTDGGRRFRIE